MWVVIHYLNLSFFVLYEEGINPMANRLKKEKKERNNEERRKKEREEKKKNQIKSNNQNQIKSNGCWNNLLLIKDS